MSKKKREPGRFQWPPTDPSPVKDAVVEDVLRAFVQQFVIPAKRERAELFLVAKKKRDRGLRDLWSWLDQQYTEELDGSTGFPQHLEERFGGNDRFFIDSGRVCLVTAPEASVLAAELADVALFVCHTHKMALWFPEIGPPTLCTAPGWDAS